MWTSLKFWVFCLLTGIFLNCIPVINSSLFLRLPIWYAIIRYFKRSKYFYRQCEWECRFHQNETVIVTGASAGIGAETAKQLAQRGAKVIWAARTTKKAQAVLDNIRWTCWHGPRGYVLPLDLADMKSIKKFTEEFIAREGRLDCLILNAGYHGPKTQTKDGFDTNIGVNHLGHMYLTYLLMEQMNKTKRQNPESAGRIVVVSSDLHRLIPSIRFADLNYDKPNTYTMAGFIPYAHSKLCNLLFVKSLSEKLKGSGLTVHAAHPGTPVQTELMRNNFLGGIIMNNFVLPPLYFLFCRQAADGAQTLIYTACSEECMKTTGKYFENLERMQPNKAAMDPEQADKLWTVSCKLLKIKPDWVKPEDDIKS